MASGPHEPPPGPQPPASDEPAAAQRETPSCPFCGSGRTEVMSLFGSHASLTTCWCAACRSPFEFLRWRAEPEGEGEPGSGGPVQPASPRRRQAGE